MSQDTPQDDVKRGTVVQDGRVYDTTSQDIEPYLKLAKAERDACPEIGKYRKKTAGMTYAGTIPLGLVEQMYRGQCCPDGVRYNVLSPDPEEARRSLVHLQTYHPECLTVKGKPFARKRPQWR